MSSYFAREDDRGRQESIKIKQIPHLTSPQRISQLDFSHNGIRTIPIHIASARNLHIIDLSHNKISKIDHLCRIPSLKFINLSYNIIAEVPNDILNLADIQNIDLAFNKIAILNNIKVLKRLVELRTFEKKGFIEINLEGNEILKKKGCMDICRKWMSPSLQDYKRHPNKDNSESYIHLAKKPNSKSLEAPLRDSSMLLTHRTHLASQKMDQTRFFQAKSKKLQDKTGSALKQSLQITEKLSPNIVNSEQQSDIKQRQVFKSQILNTVHNFQDLSKVFQSTNVQDMSNLGEWFCLCIDELNDLADKFALLVSNDDTNHLKIQVKDKIQQECSHARQIIMICLELVKEAIQNNLKKEEEQTYLKQIGTIDSRIKSQHNAILREIGNGSEALPIKLYKVWVTLYRKLKSIIYQMPQKIANHRASYARQMQIQELLSISPDKKNQPILPSHEKRQNTYKNQSNQKISASKQKLDELLFSRNKSECLLLSDHTNGRASSQKISPKRGEREQCDNCLMLKWISNKNKDEIAQLTEKVKNLETVRGEQQERIQNLQKFRQKYLNLATKQELIIGELEYLNPSTYQHFLLQQAKTIEYMLHTSDLVDYRKIGIGEEMGQNLQGYSSKQIVKDKDMLLNTRLTSTNNIKNDSNHNKVSEFSIQGREELSKENSHTARGSSYFKHKNIVTTVNRTNEDPKAHVVQQYLTTEENKPKELRRQEVVVSQFNSHVNSVHNTSSKHKNVTFEQFSTEKDQQKQQKKSKNKRKIPQKSFKLQNDVILISQGSQIKNVSLSRQETLKANSKQDNNRMFDYSKSQEFNQILRLKLKGLPQKGEGARIQRMHSLRQNQNIKQNIQRKASQKHPRMNSDLSDKQNNKPINPNIKRNKTVEKFYEDCPSQNVCAPMQSTEAESYKRYVKYHLRNNIMEILFKKSNLILHQNSEKLTHYTKTQKLINKKNTTQRSQLEEQPSRCSEINKTFR